MRGGGSDWRRGGGSDWRRGGGSAEKIGGCKLVQRSWLKLDNSSNWLVSIGTELLVLSKSPPSSRFLALIRVLIVESLMAWLQSCKNCNGRLKIIEPLTHWAVAWFIINICFDFSFDKFTFWFLLSFIRFFEAIFVITFRISIRVISSFFMEFFKLLLKIWMSLFMQCGSPKIESFSAPFRLIICSTWMQRVLKSCVFDWKLRISKINQEIWGYGSVVTSFSMIHFLTASKPGFM